MVNTNYLLSRQVGTDNAYGSWWAYSETAYIIKWIVIGIIFAFLVFFVLGGYYHAQRRMKKGLPPLRYHRWLVSRQQRARFHLTSQNPHTFYQPHGGSYPMQAYGPPPPAYHEQDYVPEYTPAQGTSKINPDQTYTAPTGPPPGQGFASSSHLNTSSGSGPTQPLRAASPYR